MGPAEFFATARLIIVAGKGGVGKTTVTAAMARCAADAGLSSLIVEVEGKSGLASYFGRPPLGDTEVELSPAGQSDGAGEVRARMITPEAALTEYLEAHGMRRLSARLLRSGAIDVVATAAPGIEDILVLGKVKQLERAGQFDVILLDAPAAGHAITFLQSARGLLDAVSVGPIKTQASEVLEMLSDPARCSVVLVTLAEETPVNELIETAYALEDRIGVHLGPVVVNGVYSPMLGLDVDPEVAAEASGLVLRHGEADALSKAAAFRASRAALQLEQMERLRQQLPLEQLRLPFLFSVAITPVELQQLARALGDAIDTSRV